MKKKENKEKNIDLLSPISYMVDAWGDVTQETIRNYWCRTEIAPLSLAARLKSSNEPRKHSDIPVLTELVPSLEITCPLSAEEYLGVDSVLVAQEDRERIELEERNVQTGSCSPAHAMETEDDDDDEVNQPYSHYEALEIAVKLSVYMFSQGLGFKLLRSVTDHAKSMVVSSMRQQSIHEFSQAIQDSLTG